MPDVHDSILQFLSIRQGQEFHAYSPQLVDQRIGERIQALGVGSADEYLARLRADNDEANCLGRMLLVRYSLFFRNPLQFQLLQEILLPPLLSRSENGIFKVWSAACAAGEEPYSLAIILSELAVRSECRQQLCIFATDVAQDALDEAQQAVYPPDRLKEVTFERIGRCFTAEGNRFRLGDHFREYVSFSRHDLLDRRTFAPPESVFGGFDLVLCRNFLMYLNDDAYQRVFDKLFKALNPGGILMLGKTETVPERYRNHLKRLYDFGGLYRKA